VAPTHAFFHGEKVAFGVLVQLVMENAPPALMQEVLAFATSVALPITLREIGLREMTPPMLSHIAERATAPGETIHNEPFPVTPALVADAIVAADAMGREWQR
jgi:glycerol dehydrogenase